MKMLFPASCNIIVAPAFEPPAIETRRYMFWYSPRYAKHRHLLGSFDGCAFVDSKFQKKLRRIRNLLNYREVEFEETWVNLHEEELAAARRLSQEQKKKRKHSKLMNAYNDRKSQIELSSDLFKADKLKELDVELAEALVKLESMYFL